MRDNLPRSMRWGRVFRFARAASLAGVAAVTSVTVTSTARADEARVRFLTEKLEDSDFRVRTNAALALGATNEESAVNPLCKALNDSSETVRQASAVGLKRLGKPSAHGCLEARKHSETNEGVKVAITRALEALGSGGGGGGHDDKIKDNPNAKYYIALSTVANATGRNQAEVERIVLTKIKQKLEAEKDVQIAPSKEAPDAARETMKKRKMKGFYLAIALDRFDYSDGNLRVKIKVGVFRYPEKDLRGSFNKEATMQGVSNGDKASEDRLMEVAAERASELFAQQASAFL
jgi:hypothetical protein